MRRLAAYLAMTVLASWGTLRGIEEGVRLIVERAVRSRQ